MTRRVYTLALAGLLVLAGVRFAAAQTYVDDAVKKAGSHHVIITVTPGREAEVLDTLKRHGASVRSQHPSVNGVAADIDGSAIADLAQHGAAAVTVDSIVRGNAASKAKKNEKVAPASTSPTSQDVSTLRLTLGLTSGSANNLATGAINGSGIGIAIIDSGIAPSADFAGRIRAFLDFTKLDKRGRPTQPAPYDDLGHGTHLAGLIASSGVQSNYMFQGIAPNASLVVLKVLDKTGAGTTSSVIAAIEYVVTNRKSLGVQVINLSLGHPITAPAKFDPLVQAIEDASRHGVIVVVAAGNDGPGHGSINSPANAPSAITVGAANTKTTVTRTDDYIPDFSSRGPTWYDDFAKPDVVAAGVNLFSNAAPNSTLVNSTTPAYPQEVVGSAPLIDLTGTSIAAAVATGVVALELDANAHQNNAPLTPNAAKAILEYTAIPVAKANYLTQGAGQINAAGASQLAGSINTLAPANSWWLQTGVSGSSTIGGATYAWAQNIIWGTSVLGGRVIYYNSRAWDDNIIWGTNRVRVRSRSFDDNIIWGTDYVVLKKNIVWATDDGDNIIWGTHLATHRVVGQRVDDNIIWGTDDVDNIIWGTLNHDNIIWGTADLDNIIWGTWSADGDNIIWGTTAKVKIVNQASSAEDNIIWGTSAGKGGLVKGKDAGDNIIWGTSGKKVVKSLDGLDNIIWGTADLDNIIWGTSDDNIIWGTGDGDNIIWGTDGDDNIIWGTSVGGRQ